MRQYKDSGTQGIGLIPQSWDSKQLGVFFSENRKANSYLESITALQFKYGEIIQKPNNGRDLSDKDKDLLSKYTVIEPGDVVVNGLNLNFDLKSLRIAIARENGIITSAYIVLRPRKGVNSEYYNYVLKALDFQKILHGMGEGIRLTLNYDELKKLIVPAPETAIQSAIVSYLDSKCGEIDSLIALQEHMIEKLKAYKQSVITEAVTKGLSPNTKLFPSGIDWIGEIPESWEVCRFKSYIHLISEKSVETTGIKVNLENIESKSGRYIPTDSKYEGDGTSFKKGDVLFGKLRPYLAKVLAPEFDGAAIGDIYVFRPTDRINTCFLKYMLLSDTFITIVDSSTYGTKMPRANWEFISCVPVVVPSLDEQRVIVSFLDEKCVEIDRLLDLKRQKIDKLKNYKKSVIYEAVTGKTIIE